MKFKELESRVATLSLGTENNYRVEHYAGQTVIVNSFALYQINENTVGSFREANDVVIIPERDRLALQKLAYKYSRTPIDERQDDPKFWVKMFPKNNGLLGSCLYLDDESNDITIFGAEAGTPFTQSEYDNLQQKYPEWLPKFDKDDPHFEFVEDGK